MPDFAAGLLACAAGVVDGNPVQQTYHFAVVRLKIILLLSVKFMNRKIVGHLTVNNSREVIYISHD